ncbi:AraC family transcriptional regulator [Levilactobacillus brevis]|nr:AraC family transcriptional regulator [Levilactobacillus brevis]
MTFSELIQKLRLKQVCFYLENTSEPIESIANTCGFSNITFFYKKFKNQYGQTPHQFRKQFHSK